MEKSLWFRLASFTLLASFMLSGVLLLILMTDYSISIKIALCGLIAILSFAFIFVITFRLTKSLEEKARQDYYDVLTNIYKRRYLDETLNRLIRAHSRAKDGTMSVLMIDIDFFKLYNDTYGHGAGDKCLKTVAEILSETAKREEDFAARYGGEEFTVVLPFTDEKGACVVAEKLLENIRNANIPHKASSVADFVTISIGIASGMPCHTLSADHFFKLADEMLYISKKEGRNKYTSAFLSDEA
jgi:diguanylate cyclase (GGDEF)-like protein